MLGGLSVVRLSELGRMSELWNLDIGREVDGCLKSLQYFSNSFLVTRDQYLTCRVYVYFCS